MSQGKRCPTSLCSAGPLPPDTPFVRPSESGSLTQLTVQTLKDSLAQMQEEIARLLLDLGVVTLRPEEPFTWVSGIRSPIYCDNRLLMSEPAARRKVRDAFLQKIREEEPKVELIAGVATGGIPHAAWIAEALAKPMVYIRAKAREHGKGNQVEGKVGAPALAVVIEDLVSTGGSSCEAVQTLRNAGVRVNHCFSIFSYGFPEALKHFEEIGCKLSPLTTFATLLPLARRLGKITSDQEKILAKFRNDPWHWLD